MEDMLSSAIVSLSSLLQFMNLGTFQDDWVAIRSLSGVPNLLNTFPAMLSFKDQSVITTEREAPSANRFS